MIQCCYPHERQNLTTQEDLNIFASLSDIAHTQGSNADQLQVGTARIELFFQIYGGKESLSSLRYAISYI